MRNWEGNNILVIGAARQGLAAARFLSSHGAHVTLNDGRSSSEFDEITASFGGTSVKFHFGDHPISLLETVDFVCVSGGVPLDLPIIMEAQKRDIPLTNDAQLFLENTSAKVIGITGSAGKTTTTTLIGEIARAGTNSPQKVWIGGNIGNPLIEHLGQITADDWVIMELSSFQLELTHTSPGIALILNITPNHLDRHKTMAAYIDAKSRILKFQNDGDIAILNRDDEGSVSQKNKVRANLLTFGLRLPASGTAGTYIRDGFIQYTNGKNTKKILNLDQIKLPGRHNQMNALAAAAAGIAAGFSYELIAKGIASVDGIPHRLETIAQKGGVRWINDSIATAPERVAAALDATPGPLVLLLGGRDKDLPWNSLAQILFERKPKIVIFGEAGEMIESVLRAKSVSADRVKTLVEAVQNAARIAVPGDTVLLSPGGTSYDAFRDFEERGNQFRQLVEQIK